MASYFKTALLLAALTALFMGAGFLMAGQTGMLIALVIAAAMNLFAWWNSGTTVLRYYKAKEVDSGHSLHRIVAALAKRDGMPMPKVYLIENPQPNAFATGRGPKNASVAATTGLLQLMNEQEVAGVMAHELAHVKHRDTLIMTVTATVAGALSMLANFALFFGGGRNNQMGIIGMLAMMILAPMAAMLVQMAISRTREYEADRGGAEICGNPDWLADALEKLEAGSRQIDNHAAENNPATAHMFIINPLHAHKRDKMFSTHPNTANRVARLQDMSENPGAPSVVTPAGTQGPWSPRSPRVGTPSDKKAGRGSVPGSGSRRGPWAR